MPEGKRRYKQRRTCYLSMIARDWFLCFINHSYSKTCSAPIPTLRLIIDSVQEGSNDTGFQTSVSRFYFNSLQPHCLKALLACSPVRIHTLFPCVLFIFFSRLRKTQQVSSNNKASGFFLRWNSEYYNWQFSCLPKFLRVISCLMDQLIHRPRTLPAISLLFH